MGVYAVDPSTARSVARRRLFLGALLFALLPGIYIAIDLARGARDKLPIDLEIALVFLVALGIGAFGAYRDSVKRLTSFRLIVTPEEISWQKPDASTLIVRRENVRRIVLHSSGDVIVRAERRSDSIRIPSPVGSKDALMAELSVWRPIENARLSQWHIRALQLLAGIGMLALFVVLHGRPVVWLVLAGLLLISGLLNLMDRQKALKERLTPFWGVPVLLLQFFLHANDATRATRRAELRLQVEACKARIQVIGDKTTDEMLRLNDLRRALAKSEAVETRRKYDALEAALKADLAEYQIVVDKHNALAAEYNALLANPMAK
jgi:IS5 family transposase